jgi:hypothetical protein
MGQAGNDLIEMLRTKNLVVPGQPGQEKLKI